MNIKTLLPHIIAVVVFFLTTVILFHPTFFNGEKLFQNDIMQSIGANNQLKEYRAQNNEEPLWMNSMFSGMPAYLNGVSYSGDLLTPTYNLLILGLGHPVGIPFLAMICFYVMLLAFGVNPWVAIGGSILYAVNGFNIISIGAGHNAKVAAAALMPLVLAGIRWTLHGKKWLGIGLTTLALAFEIRASHPQMTYYLLLFTIAYGLYELYLAYRAKTLRPFFIHIGLLVVAAIVAVGANYGKLYHTYEYGKYSIRGGSELKGKNDSGLDYDYAFDYSNAVDEPMVLFFPNYYGGASSNLLLQDPSSDATRALRRNINTDQRLQNPQLQEQLIRASGSYWGDQGLSAPYYAGSIMLFLLVFALYTLPLKEKIWLLIIAAFGALLTLGANSEINYFLFDNLPGYNKFRSVTFTIIIPILALNILGFRGISQWLDMEAKDQWRTMKWASLVTFGICVFFWLIGSMYSFQGPVDKQLTQAEFGWLSNAMAQDRLDLFRQDVLRALLFTLAVGIVLYLRYAKIIGTEVLAIGLIVIIGVDIIPLSKRYLNKDNFQEDPLVTYFRPTSVDSYLLQNTKDGERILDFLGNPWANGRASYYHESIGGYHGAKLARYQDLIANHLDNEFRGVALQLNQLDQSKVDSTVTANRNFSPFQVLGMLNTRYFLYGSRSEQIVINGASFGNAWIAQSVKDVKGPQEEIDALGTENLRTTAVVNTSQFDLPESTGRGNILLQERKPDYLKYTALVQGGKGLGVFSEIYYPKGWTAKIDGQEASMLRANYVLRALEIPEGTHTVEFFFEPASYGRSNTLMLIFGILTFLAFIGGILMEVREGKQRGED